MFFSDIAERMKTKNLIEVGGKSFHEREPLFVSKELCHIAGRSLLRNPPNSRFSLTWLTKTMVQIGFWPHQNTVVKSFIKSVAIFCFPKKYSHVKRLFVHSVCYRNKALVFLLKTVSDFTTAIFRMLCTLPGAEAFWKKSNLLYTFIYK